MRLGAGTHLRTEQICPTQAFKNNMHRSTKCGTLIASSLQPMALSCHHGCGGPGSCSCISGRSVIGGRVGIEQVETCQAGTGKTFPQKGNRLEVGVPKTAKGVLETH